MAGCPDAKQQRHHQRQHQQGRSEADAAAILYWRQLIHDVPSTGLALAEGHAIAKFAPTLCGQSCHIAHHDAMQRNNKLVAIAIHGGLGDVAKLAHRTAGRQRLHGGKSTGEFRQNARDH